MSIRGILEAIKDAVPAAGGAAATGLGGDMLAAPGWLVALGQAAVVVYFTTRTINNRMKEISELRGEVATLTGRFKGLACVSTPTAGKPEECLEREKKGA